MNNRLAIFATRKCPQLTLVGAGPGDPELITVKGARALAEADVVLYDALANETLLQYVRPGVPKIYVGKRGGSSYKSQAEINELIVNCAYQYGHVVRLKGGDPYIFGRGHEEQTFAEEQGISVAVVPGISSVYSVPALQSIPLTKRGISESFWVITGTTRNGTLSHDVALAAQSTATVVILMGMRQLPKIQAVFETYGQGETPVAIVQNGSLPEEKMGVATVSSMVEMAEEEKLGSPAIIVIGDVVRERNSHSVQALVKTAAQYA
uniref:uroporphyrinogen-III C-methyltransferase n=1 Tax=Roseihalotalea indica TaxID=2867963 RepID=A0AA49GMU7_9BACT|nr:uroporphyrinogen-III C-methyltransferase [Tunicatimonas sp. TK19036]